MTGAPVCTWHKTARLKNDVERRSLGTAQAGQTTGRASRCMPKNAWTHSPEAGSLCSPCRRLSTPFRQHHGQLRAQLAGACASVGEDRFLLQWRNTLAIRVFVDCMGFLMSLCADTASLWPVQQHNFPNWKKSQIRTLSGHRNRL